MMSEWEAANMHFLKQWEAQNEPVVSLLKPLFQSIPGGEQITPANAELIPFPHTILRAANKGSQIAAWKTTFLKLVITWETLLVYKRRTCKWVMLPRLNLTGFGVLRGIIMSEWIKFRERSWLKVVMKILKGEFVACSAGKGVMLIQQWTKNTIYQSRPLSSLGQQPKTSKKKKKKKQCSEGALTCLCTFYLSFVPFIFQQRVPFIPSRSGGNKNDCVKDPAAAAASARKQTKRDCQTQIGNTLAWQNHSYYVSKLITQLANQMWFPH